MTSLDRPQPSALSVRGEWALYWPLPFVGALGASVSTMHIYSIGPFIQPLVAEFDWSRAQISSGIAIANAVSGLLSIVAGLLIDRVGPRRVGLAGTAIMCAAVASLVFVTGGMANWILHWSLIGIGLLFVQTTIWAGAVSSRFHAGRGLALAITMCGSSLSAMIMPLTGAWLIQQFGWRMAFPALAGLWAAVLLPMLFLFFRGAQDRPRGGLAETRRHHAAADSDASLPGLTLAEGFRSPAFYKLMLTGGVYSFVLIGAIVHFIPILEDRGRDALSAAGIAGFIGVASITGRFVTGVLLDHFRGDRVAPIAFLLPTLGLVMMIYGGGAFAIDAGAAVVIGLSLGAELDVIAYLATRYFGLRTFGSLFAATITALSLGTSLGPLAAGTTFDRTGSYALFLLIGIPLMVLCAAVLATLGPYPRFETRPAKAPTVTDPAATV